MHWFIYDRDLRHEGANLKHGSFPWKLLLVMFFYCSPCRDGIVEMLQ